MYSVTALCVRIYTMTMAACARAFSIYTREKVYINLYNARFLKQQFHQSLLFQFIPRVKKKKRLIAGRLPSEGYNFSLIGAKVQLYPSWYTRRIKKSSLRINKHINTHIREHSPGINY